MQAACIAGIAVTWGYIQPKSVLGGIAAVVSGVALTIMLYVAAYSLNELYLPWAHRMAAPILPATKTAENEKLAKIAFEKLLVHRRYPEFKEIWGMNEDQRVYEYFKSLIPLGICHGSAAELLHVIKKCPTSTCAELLSSIKAENIYYFQFISNMKSCIQMRESQLRKRAWQLKSFSHMLDPGFKNLYSERGTLYPEGSEENSELQAMIRVGKSLQELANELQMDLSPSKETESEPFSLKKSSGDFDNQWKKLMGSDSEFSGRIELCGNEEDMRHKRSGHVLTFHVTQGKFRFYDTINASAGGFYEYDTLQEFTAALKKQVSFDLMTYKDIIVKLIKSNPLTS